MRLLWVAMTAAGILASACGGGGGTPSHEDDPLGGLSWEPLTVTTGQVAASSTPLTRSQNANPIAAPTPLLTPAILPPDQLAAVLIPRVRGARPLLLPAGISSRWAVEATLESLSGSDFRVTYTRRAEPAARLSLSIALANPPLPEPGITSQDHPAFRRDPAAFYQVMDPVDPDSPRQLMWKEPGRWAPADSPEQTWTPYYLTATGLTDDEFWSIANSLRDVSD